jgi:hypothetical protein
MQLTLDRTILENLLELAASASRRAGSIEHAAVGPLSDGINAIAHEISELLDNPHLIAAPIAIAVGGLRQRMARADALATAARDLLDETRTEGDDARRLERLAHLVGATVEAVLMAVATGDKLADDLATRRVGA